MVIDGLSYLLPAGFKRVRNCRTGLAPVSLDALAPGINGVLDRQSRNTSLQSRR